MIHEGNHPATWYLYIDGAARNNPGPAGAGIYLLKENTPVEEQGIFLGIKTNNQAEYLALLFGLLYARRHMAQGDKLVIKSDSQLLVRQLCGLYSIKNSHIQRLCAQIKEYLSGLNYTIEHIVREHNKSADKLANMGIDKKIPIPLEFVTVWNAYEYPL